MTAQGAEKSRRRAALHYSGLAAIVLFYAYNRLAVAALPLERDEGEYAYGGQIILQGESLYRFVYTMKWPGTHAMYAAFMAVFGQTAFAIRLGLIVATSVTAILVFALATRVFGATAGVLAAAAQLQLSSMVGALGPFAHATHFVALFATAAFVLLLPREQAPPGYVRLFIAGVLLGVAALMKQPAAAFALTAIVAILIVFERHPPGRRAIAAFVLLAGVGVPIVIMVAAVSASGTLAEFWLWTWRYAREYAREESRSADAMMLWTTARKIVPGAAILLACATAGAVLLFRGPTRRGERALITALAAGGLLATVPGFHFREQYFIAAFPGLAMFVAAFTAGLQRGRILRAAAIAFVAAGVGAGVAHDWRWYHLGSPLRQMREVYEFNPFVEAQEIGKVIRGTTSTVDRIAVAGSEPEIYFYAGRLASAPYMYVYPLVTRQKFAHAMQIDMLNTIVRSRPKYLVYVNVSSSWGATPDSDPTLMRGLQKFAAAEYQIAGIAEVLPGGSRYLWGDQVRQLKRPSKYFVVVMKRRQP